MKKRELIIVNSLCNLVLAVQLRETTLASDEVDLILGYGFLKDVYKSGKLDDVFSHVYFTNQQEYYSWSLVHFFKPKVALKTMLDCKDITIYDDIFFWNPDWIFYHFFKYYKQINHKVNWHIYGDAISQYLIDIPDNSLKYTTKDLKGNLLNFLDKLIWQVPLDIGTMNYDFYLFQPERFLTDKHKVHVEIPIICANGKFVSLLNDIWQYSYVPAKEKIIYLDTAREGQLDNDDILGVLSKLQDNFGKDNIIVKPHPRVDLSIYSPLDLNFMDKNIPWELFCMNGGLQNKIIVCEFSSAVCLPYYWFGLLTDTISVMDMIKLNDVCAPIEKRMLLDINENTKKVFLPKDANEMINKIKQIW